MCVTLPVRNPIRWSLKFRFQTYPLHQASYSSSYNILENLSDPNSIIQLHIEISSEVSFKCSTQSQGWASIIDKK